VLALSLEQFWYLNTQCVRHSDQRSYGGIPAPQFQVRQVAAFHDGAFGKLLLGPASRIPEVLDARGHLP
jgi:hypothetical protein